MDLALGVTWTTKAVRKAVAALVVTTLVAGLMTAPRARSESAQLVSVIVRQTADAGARVEQAIEDLGGQIVRRIAIIDGFVAVVPAAEARRMSGIQGVLSVTPNRPIRLLHAVDGFDGGSEAGSMYNAAKTVRATDLWRKGVTGQGVDVAMIDSGVAPVDGLRTPGKIFHGPDLSFESQASNLYNLDTFGHGTHLAGIISGRKDGVDPSQYDDHDNALGIAPDSRLVSLKVANAQGATDVSQVLAAIDWVVQHRNDNGLNIRVLNLSFGTDGIQDYRIDPLAYAAEVAWRKGIVVVVAAGNEGFGTAKLNNPAYDPYVIAVGADDSRGTFNVNDDVIPAWSSRGDGVRNPDVVAPGKSLASLRTPGSNIDQTHPEGLVNSKLFRGSGTSQAAAVTSGAAALLLQERPNLTPDQVKKLLTSTATKLPAADPQAQGSGLVNLKDASAAPAPAYTQTWATSSGTGSLDLARGSAHVVSPDGATLAGEQDIFGNAWNGATWSGATWSGATWSGGSWNGATWSGATWSGATWSGATWSGATWSGATWSGATWSGATWSGATWSGATWSGATWSGATWSGATWSGATWSGATWSSQSWGSDVASDQKTKDLDNDYIDDPMDPNLGPATNA